MMAQRWDPARRAYSEYGLPAGASCYEADMGAVVSCARCGARVAYGDCYTSRQIHTGAGFGYAVCPACYQEEWREEAIAHGGGKA